MKKASCEAMKACKGMKMPKKKKEMAKKASKEEMHESFKHMKKHGG